MSEPHSAGHHMWHGIDPSHPLHQAPTAEQARRRLIEVYDAVDAEIGRLIDGLPADTSVAVFAVHGMQPNANDVPSMVLLPELLHRITFGTALHGVRGGATSLYDGSELRAARRASPLADHGAAFVRRGRHRPGEAAGDRVPAVALCSNGH